MTDSRHDQKDTDPPLEREGIPVRYTKLDTGEFAVEGPSDFVVEGAVIPVQTSSGTIRHEVVGEMVEKRHGGQVVHKVMPSWHYVPVPGEDGENEFLIRGPSDTKLGEIVTVMSRGGEQRKEVVGRLSMKRGDGTAEYYTQTVTNRKLPDGTWGIVGPLEMMKEGNEVTVIRKDGSIDKAVVGEFVADEPGGRKAQRKVSSDSHSGGGGADSAIRFVNLAEENASRPLYGVAVPPGLVAAQGDTVSARRKDLSEGEVTLGVLKEEESDGTRIFHIVRRHWTDDWDEGDYDDDDDYR